MSTFYPPLKKGGAKHKQIISISKGVIIIILVQASLQV